MTNEPIKGQVEIDAKVRLAAIVESSDDAILSKTLEGIITSWNKGAEHIFGYTAEEIIGLPMTTLFPPDRMEEEPHILARISRGERVDHFETVRVAKDGRLVEISATISPVRDSAGRIIGASKIARDITQQKRTERELRVARDAADAAKQTAEAANRAKDHFLSVLSHELRTPLTPVLAALSFIEADPKLSANEMRHHLDMIRRNVETEARLVDDLLDVTRISQGKLRLQMETVNAHASIRNVIAMLHSEIDAKGLELTLGLRAKDFQIRADSGRFQQILLNLLSNAIKFTPQHGTISIHTANEVNHHELLRIDISDTGIGIDSETLPRLFKPFEQGERTVTRQFGGLGLGLSIVRQLIEMHNGSISASSDGPGKGAKFSLKIGTAVAEQPKSTAGANAPCEAPDKMIGCRILLVEDHDDTRQMLSMLLSNFGCKVTAVPSVQQAVDLASAQDFDLLVSDIGLPDGSGMDVMRQIRIRQNIPGIALSGFGQDEDVERSRQAGFDHHLVKPINFQKLREVMLDLKS